MVKILGKYTEFLKSPFYNWASSQTLFNDFDYNYYNNSLKYAGNRTPFFFVTPVTVSTKSKVYLKYFFCKFEDVGK